MNNIITGLQMIFSGLLDATKKATFALAFGTLALSLTIIGVSFLKEIPQNAVLLLYASTLSFGSIVGRNLDNRSKNKELTNKKLLARIEELALSKDKNSIN